MEVPFETKDIAASLRPQASPRSGATLFPEVRLPVPARPIGIDRARRAEETPLADARPRPLPRTGVSR